MLFLIFWTEGDITSVIGVESQEAINGVITPFMSSCFLYPETFFNPRPEEILERFNCQTTDTMYFIKRQPKQLKIKQ